MHLLVPYPQSIRAPLLPHPCQHLSSFVFQMMMSTLIDVGWDPKISLICISLMATDVKHGFMWFLAITISSLWNFLFMFTNGPCFSSSLVLNLAPNFSIKITIACRNFTLKLLNITLGFFSSQLLFPPLVFSFEYSNFDQILNIFTVDTLSHTFFSL